MSTIQSMNITLNLSAEDRARLDKLAEMLEAQIELTVGLIDIIGRKPTATIQMETPEEDELTKKLRAIAEGTETTQEATNEPTPPITPEEEETPTEEEKTEPPTEREITLAELGAKVRELMTSGFKEETRDIVRSYAQTVSGVPKDKINECYGRLEALGAQK